MFGKARTVDVLQALLESPEAKAIAKDREAKIAAERIELARERETLERDAGVAFVAHSREIDGAVGAHKAAQDALRRAADRVTAAVGARSNASYRFTAEISRVESALRETAHPAIDEFISELGDEFDKTLRLPFPDDSTVVANINTGKKTRVPGKPVVKPPHRVQAIREAIAAAEALKLDADQSGIGEKLKALHDRLPIVGEPRE